MAQKSETPPGSGASRISCGGSIRELLTPTAPHSQAIPPLIDEHIGESFLARWTEDACHD